MPSLLELSREEQALLQAIYDADGEISDEQSVQLTKLGETLAQKADRCATFLRVADREIEGLRESEKALAKKRHQLEAQVERFKEYVLSVLGPDGERKGERGVIRWRWATKRKLKILAKPHEFPDAFLRTTLVLDEGAVRQILEQNANGNRDAVSYSVNGVELARLEPPTPWLEAK